MHDALSHPRLHNERNHVVGDFCLDGPERLNALFGGGGYCVRVDRPLGKALRVVGAPDARNRTWLLPEEALFLIERGTLDIRWPLERESNGEDGEAREESEDGGATVPMSLQAAYACLIGRSGLTLEKYIVYASLRRLGYTVTRAATWDEAAVHANDERLVPPSEMRTQPSTATSTALSSSTGLGGFMRRMLSFLYAPPRPGDRACGPMVTPGLYRNYIDVFRALTLIPSHDPSKRPQTAPNLLPPFHICYDVYKPSTPYRRSAPPEPDFRLVVLDARSTSVPRLDQIGALLDSMPHTPPRENAQIGAKLKLGHRTVHLAVVDMGVVSYLRFSDAAFGVEKLYERKFPQKAKRKRSGYGGQRGKRNSHTK